MVFTDFLHLPIICGTMVSEKKPQEAVEGNEAGMQPDGGLREIGGERMDAGRGMMTPEKTEQAAEIYIDRKRRTAEFQMATEHYHHHYELFYLAAGRCRVFMDHSLYHLEAGDMVLIAPMAIHHTSYGITQESERIALSFHERYLVQMEEECGCEIRNQMFRGGKLSIDPGRRNYLENLLQKTQVEQDTQDVFSGLLQRAYLKELFVFLVRCGRENVQKEPTDVAEAEIQAAAQYIFHHFSEPLTLDEVAGRVHMTPTYFSRKFKRVTGIGYKEYLNHVRLKEAARLLLETDLSVTGIALACGFSDGNYFGDLFKKEKGISPRMYRKNPQIM